MAVGPSEGRAGCGAAAAAVRPATSPARCAHGETGHIHAFKPRRFKSARRTVDQVVDQVKEVQGDLAQAPAGTCPAGCLALGASAASATGLPSCVCVAATAGALRGAADGMRAALVPAVAGMALAFVGATWLLARCAGAAAEARAGLRARRASRAGGLPSVELVRAARFFVLMPRCPVVAARAFRSLSLPLHLGRFQQGRRAGSASLRYAAHSPTVIGHHPARPVLCPLPPRSRAVPPPSDPPPPRPCRRGPAAPRGRAPRRSPMPRCRRGRGGARRAGTRGAKRPLRRRRRRWCSRAAAPTSIDERMAGALAP